jgi:uncharacterized protein GlcG (DUF336 family)
MDLLELSKNLSTLIEDESRRIGVPVTVSVVDIHGNLVLKQRMPGAPVLSLEMSERKAYTSALLRMRTAELTPLVLPGQPLYTLTSVAGGRFVALGGGIPIHQGNEVVAGFGVSGGTTEQDVSIAENAFRRFETPH